MYQFFVEPSQIRQDEKEIVIRGRDAHHMRDVLRLHIGEEVSVRLRGQETGEADAETTEREYRFGNIAAAGQSQGEGEKEYRCGIKEYRDNEVILTLYFIKEAGVELPSPVVLFQGLPKGDKMELIIQKAVELGVSEIVPMRTRRTVVKPDEKRAQAKTARWQAIAEAAAKQSKRGILPRVGHIRAFKEAVAYAGSLDVLLFPYELAEDMARTRSVIDGISPGASVGIFIGPEGGFAEEEVMLAREAGAQPITLGRRILRTETAGLVVLSWLVYRLEGLT